MTDNFKDFCVREGKIPAYLFDFLQQFALLQKMSNEFLKKPDLEKGLEFFEKPIRTKITTIMGEINKQYKQMSILFENDLCEKELNMRFDLFRFLGFDDLR